MPAADALIGSVLDGKYRIDRLLGRGGMGEVYEGTHLRLQRPVAVKVMHVELGSDETFVNRFEREARAAARLEHPNAVHVYDFGSLEDGSAYLVMEYIDGVSLRDVLRKQGRFSLPAAVDVMRQACSAIAAAHARGIVHRDLKPENMMLRADEAGRPFLKVVDFGLAKLLENQTSQLTKGQELMGTPRYMAPEQFASGARVDERVDVYALGCVLFELLTGHAPYEGTFLEVVGKHVYAEPPAVEAGGAEIPEAVQRVVHHALAKDPAQRTPSAADLARELEGAAAGAVAAQGEGVTAPLPPSHDTEARESDELVTKAAPASVRLPDEFATRPVAHVDLDDEATRVRGVKSPTVVIPQAEASEPPTTALPYAPPQRLVASRPARRWLQPAAFAVTAVAAGTVAYYAFTPRPVTPLTPAAAPFVVPSPASYFPEPESDPDEPPEVTHEPRPPAPPKHPKPTPNPDDFEVGPIDIPPDAFQNGDEMPSAEQLRHARRILRQIELERRRREAQQRRQQQKP
jgi:serine/threonine-protein kinase